MNTLGKDARVSECIRGLRHLGIRLGSRPDTVALTSSVDVARNRLTTADEAWQEAVEVRVATKAELDYAQWAEGRGVLDLSRDVLAQVRGRRDDPRWMTMFPSAPSASVGDSALPDQAAYVRLVLDVLATVPDFADLAPKHRPILERNRAAVEAVLVRRERAAVAERRALLVREQAQSAAVLAYNHMALHLKMIFPGQRALVESFFPKKPRSRGASETPIGMAAK